MYNKKTVFWIACVGMLLFGVCLITLGSVAQDLKTKLQLDNLSSGTLFSILPLGILTGSLLFGPIADRYGYRILLSACCFFMFAGFEGLAFSTSSVFLKLFIFLFGLGGGAINGSTNALVSDISDQKNKAANLSLLGVFYGIGAIGMPILSGILNKRYGFEDIIAVIGILTLVIGIFFLFIKFPPAKQQEGFSVRQGFSFLKDDFLLIVSFFLFFQSGFEAIINNWTTTYLTNQHSFSTSNALFGLSAFVSGMIIMRLLNGSILRSVPVKKILISSFVMILVALTIIKADSYVLSISGLVLLGAGLASGFPVMLGIIGEKYKEYSGTAFSLALTISLIGNTLINFIMGYLVERCGIKQLINFAYLETIIMILLCLFVLNRIREENKLKN